MWIFAPVLLPIPPIGLPALSAGADFFFNPIQTFCIPQQSLKVDFIASKLACDSACAKMEFLPSHLSLAEFPRCSLLLNLYHNPSDFCSNPSAVQSILSVSQESGHHCQS